MKARITHMKAPWPLGAVVGDVVEFQIGAVPPWAAGKCVPVEEDAEVQHLIAPPSAAPAADEQSDPAEKAAGNKKK